MKKLFFYYVTGVWGLVFLIFMPLGTDIPTSVSYIFKNNSNYISSKSDGTYESYITSPRADMPTNYQSTDINMAILNLSSRYAGMSNAIIKDMPIYPLALSFVEKPSPFNPEVFCVLPRKLNSTDTIDTILAMDVSDAKEQGESWASNGNDGYAGPLQFSNSFGTGVAVAPTELGVIYNPSGSPKRRDAYRGSVCDRWSLPDIFNVHWGHVEYNEEAMPNANKSKFINMNGYSRLALHAIGHNTGLSVFSKELDEVASTTYFNLKVIDIFEYCTVLGSPNVIAGFRDIVNRNPNKIGRAIYDNNKADVNNLILNAIQNNNILKTYISNHIGIRGTKTTKIKYPIYVLLSYISLEEKFKGG